MQYHEIITLSDAKKLEPPAEALFLRGLTADGSMREVSVKRFQIPLLIISVSLQWRRERRPY